MTIWRRIQSIVWRPLFYRLKRYQWFRNYIKNFKRDFPWVPEDLPDDPSPRPLPPDEKEPSDKELSARLHRIYDTISKNIERENALINFRITWACILSAGILGAEGVIINYVAGYHAGDPFFHRSGQTGVVFLSLLAIFFCLMSLFGVNAAQRQMEYVKLAYRVRKSQFAIFGFPRPYGRSWNHRVGNYAARAFPLALICLWTVFLIPQVVQLGVLFFDPIESLKPFRAKQDTESASRYLNVMAIQVQRLEGQRQFEQISSRIDVLSKQIDANAARPIVVQVASPPAPPAVQPPPQIAPESIKPPLGTPRPGMKKKKKSRKNKL